MHYSLELPCRRRCNFLEPDGMDELIHSSEQFVITEIEGFMAETAGKIAFAGAAWPDKSKLVVDLV